MGHVRMNVALVELPDFTVLPHRTAAEHHLFAPDATAESRAQIHVRSGVGGGSVNGRRGRW